MQRGRTVQRYGKGGGIRVGSRGGRVTRGRASCLLWRGVACAGRCPRYGAASAGASTLAAGALGWTFSGSRSGLTPLSWSAHAGRRRCARLPGVVTSRRAPASCQVAAGVGACRMGCTRNTVAAVGHRCEHAPRRIPSPVPASHAPWFRSPPISSPDRSRSREHEDGNRHSMTLG